MKKLLIVMIAALNSIVSFGQELTDSQKLTENMKRHIAMLFPGKDPETVWKERAPILPEPKDWYGVDTNLYQVAIDSGKTSLSQAMVDGKLTRRNCLRFDMKTYLIGYQGVAFCADGEVKSKSSGDFFEEVLVRKEKLSKSQRKALESTPSLPADGGIKEVASAPFHPQPAAITVITNHITVVKDPHDERGQQTLYPRCGGSETYRQPVQKVYFAR